MSKENFLDLSILDSTFYELLFDHLINLHKQVNVTS